jgi:hypothetical protein
MAMTDTGLSGEAFPNEWHWSTDQALAEDGLPVSTNFCRARALRLPRRAALLEKGAVDLVVAA